MAHGYRVPAPKLGMSSSGVVAVRATCSPGKRPDDFYPVHRSRAPRHEAADAAVQSGSSHGQRVSPAVAWALQGVRGGRRGKKEGEERKELAGLAARLGR